MADRLEHMTLTALVGAAVDHDEEAWNELVRRFAGLVAATVRRYRLSRTDAQDVSQFVWLRLVEHLSALREPAALPGWLSTTTRHECERHLRTNGRSVATDPTTLEPFDHTGDPHIDDSLLADERRRTLLEGLAELSTHQRDLLLMLSADPPYAYAEISRTMGIPVGSIGPTRSRILARLRETAPVKAYLGVLEH
jgi:RNA polymerase sigma factor (sigma-70 family)